MTHRRFDARAGKGGRTPTRRGAPPPGAPPVRATARVESIAAGGAGVARVDGLAVFVPRTAPGDVADFTYVRKDRLGHGRLRTIVEPGPHRIAARCRHYEGDRCGGCQLQHLDIEAQREAKRRIVADAFARIARRPVDVPPLVPSPEAWGYRNKLTLTLRNDAGHWRAGLHQWDDVDRVFTLEECPITHPKVVAGWREVMAAEGDLPRIGELRGAVRLAGDSLAFVLEGVKSWAHARDFAGRLPSFSVVRWTDQDARVHDVLDVDPDRPAASFEQVNSPVAERLHADVVSWVQEQRPATVVDAYAGVGDTAAVLAQAGLRVTAIELDREASAHSARRLEPPSRAICARVEDVIAHHLPADVVILNPPRTGVDARVCASLEASLAASRETSRETPREGATREGATRDAAAHDLAGGGGARIVYVSCNPATLARDVARLPSYRVARVQPYDMFPQTAHVETVCLLVPEV
ncbi:MAG: class I SAM-dependent RNA methyltransferase [Gemmatimonadaceae bacterium]|nr:class I SAM-dependent RNA methyltransferase [Gemmatimonadaceae bacterium]